MKDTRRSRGTESAWPTGSALARRRVTDVDSVATRNDDTPKHDYFVCGEAAERRGPEEDVIRRTLTPESLVWSMLEGAENWEMIRRLGEWGWKARKGRRQGVKMWGRENG